MKSSRVTEEELAGLMQNRTRVSIDRASAATPTQKVESLQTKNKYNAKKTVVGGETFDSKKEAARWVDLKARQLAGEIRNLIRQVRLSLEIDGDRICVYVCDFRYEEKHPRGYEQRGEDLWHTVYEDAKGMRTPVYLLKKKLVKAILKIEILET